MEDLDEIDRRILQVLQTDAATPASQIATVVGITQAPCWRRIGRLKSAGYITHTIALLNRNKMNLSSQFFVQICMGRNSPESIEQFSEAIHNFPEVMDCYAVIGTFDFLLRVVTSDTETFEKFRCEKLARLPNVREITSYPSFSQMKFTTALPIVE